MLKGIEKDVEEWVGLMVHFMMVNGWKEWEMELANIIRQMVSFIKDSGCKIWNMDKDIWEISMGIKSLEHGSMIGWMAKQNIKRKILKNSRM
jgi:hypothetical protein